MTAIRSVKWQPGGVPRAFCVQALSLQLRCVTELSRLVTILFLSAMLVAACASPGVQTPTTVLQPPGDRELDGIAAAVTKELPTGVRLLSVRRQDASIVLDLSDELLAVRRGGELEDTLHRLLAAASSARSLPRPPVEDYRILINGVPLEKRIP